MCSTEQWLELEVPPDVGNGSENAGLPLARLLWHLSPPALVGLIEALMLVRTQPLHTHLTSSSAAQCTRCIKGSPSQDVGVGIQGLSRRQ